MSPSPQQFPTITALGLMSGTSLDGLDMAVLKSDGLNHIEALHHASRPFPDSLRQALLACHAALPQPPIPPFDDEVTAQIAATERQYSEFVIAAVQEFLLSCPAPPDYIGWHGQTIAHAPTAGFTYQLAQGQVMAEAVGIPTVTDFRQADMAASGQGAPFAPIYHYAIATLPSLSLPSPVLFVNIGGVANVTYCGDRQGEKREEGSGGGLGGGLVACDCGPGNALMDDVMAEFNQRFDKGGEHAARGNIDEALLQKFLSLPFFSAPPPKSLHRQDFHALLEDLQPLSLEDKLATLCELTVSAIVTSYQWLPDTPKTLIICGGGRHNDFLMARLKHRSTSPVIPIDDLGFDGDMLEAQAFAYLAIRHVHNLPLSYPQTTGVPTPTLGGTLHIPNPPPNPPPSNSHEK